MKVLGIIPARFGSSRLEGKPLLNIAGMSMIQRVYEQCKSCHSLYDVIVATDDSRILDECQKNQMNAMMTSVDHLNGTERCAEVVRSLEVRYDLIVNIQGDEPFIHPESITEIIDLFKKYPEAKIGTLKKKISLNSDIFNSNIIKVVSDIHSKAIYFSRSPIPYLRGFSEDEYFKNSDFYKHIGMYAFRPETILELVKLNESDLERAEKLEQLRWMENGYEIYIRETEFESKSIDTLDDYNFILKNLHQYE